MTGFLILQKIKSESYRIAATQEEVSYEKCRNLYSVRLSVLRQSEEVDYANEHDYYYVPSVYYEGKKYFEAHPGDSLEKIKHGIMAAFDKAVYDGPGEEYIESGQKGI